MSETWLTSQDVADRLKVSSAWVLRKARCRVIPSFRIGGIIRFSEKKVDEWIREHSEEGCLKV